MGSLPDAENVELFFDSRSAWTKFALTQQTIVSIFAAHAYCGGWIHRNAWRSGAAKDGVGRFFLCARIRIAAVL